MIGSLPRLSMLAVALQFLAAPAWGRAPSEWLRIDALPGVRLAVEHGANGPENVRLRVGLREQVFRVETLAAGTVLYHWGDQAAVQAWGSAGSVPQAALHATLQAGDALGGLHTSLHPWDTVTYGRAQLEIVLRETTRLLVAEDDPQDASGLAGDASLAALMSHVAGSRAAWADLFHLAGLSGVYMGSVPPHSTTPGHRWVVLDDAAALRQVRVATPQALRQRLRGAAWSLTQSRDLATPLLQFLAVARVEAHGVDAAGIRAALPPELAWFSRVLDAPADPSSAQREALWAAVPPVPAAWAATGFTPQRTLCSLTQGAALVDLEAASLCRAFVARMCTADDVEP